MKPTFVLALLVASGSSGCGASGDASQPATPSSLVYSTYLGGSQRDVVGGDAFADSAGNLYAAGATFSPDFPTTQGAFDRTFNDTTGSTDAFLAKYDPRGQLIYSTFFGGPQRDEFNSVQVDGLGYIYLAGSAGPGMPTTAGVVYPTFQGGPWDGYVAKVAPDGSLAWATYLGTSGDDSIRSLAIDPAGSVYVATHLLTGGRAWPASWFTWSFQSTPRGGMDTVVVKLSGDGRRVAWASYLGGRSDESASANIALDGAGNVLVLTDTKSSDMPTTPGAHDLTHNGGSDVYIARLSSNGTTLLMGTYYGSPSDDGAGGKRAIAVDASGGIFVGGWTMSSAFPTTPDSFRPTYDPLSSSAWGASNFTSKFSPTGALLGSAYLGNAEGVSVDSSGAVVFSANTANPALPVTPDAFQTIHRGGRDLWVARVSNDLRTVLYASYLGGTGEDSGRSSATGPGGTFFIAGETPSRDWPLRNAFQNTFGGGAADAFVAKFAILP